MPDVAVWDLVAPYFLLGEELTDVHAALAVLRAEEWESAEDLSGVVVRGRARFHGSARPWVDLQRMTFGVTAGNTEGGPRDDPAQRDPWLDLRDTTVDFHLVAPRVQAATVQAALAAVPPAAPVADALAALDGDLADPPPSDYPTSEFVLDLVLTSAVLRPPGLYPAKLRVDGLLEPDPTYTSVAITLPKIKLRLAQSSAIDPQLTLTLLSLGASGLDDPGDLRVAQLASMDPPYAFIGSGRSLGFGFRSAVLDLSDGATPPDVLGQFGFDESWTGVYFPEIRLFVAPQGAEGLAVDVGVRNLLVGIGAHAGITGDFEADVINQGSGDLKLGARFYAPDGSAIGITRLREGRAEVMLPPRTRMIVDVSGRRPPYTTSTTIDGGAATSDRVIDVTMDAGERTIVISASADGTTATLTITARPRPAGAALMAPPGAPGEPPAVTASTTTRGGVAVDGPRLVIDSHNEEQVTLRLEDRSLATWTVDGAAVDGGASTSLITIDLDAGESKSVQATGAGTSTTAPVYLRFDDPDNLSDAQIDAYADNEANTHTTPAVDVSPSADWLPGGSDVEDSSLHREALRSLAPGGTVTVVGHASFEPTTAANYNDRLSERRAKVASRVYRSLRDGLSAVTFTVVGRGSTDARPAQQAGSPRREWWRAELASAVMIPGAITTGVVERPADEEPIRVVDPPVERPDKPPFFRSIGVKVRFIRGEFIAFEIHGEIDIDTAAEEALRDRAPADDVPQFQALSSNPADGIVAYRGVFTRNPSDDEWALMLMVGANPSDVDGLAMTGAPAGSVVPRSVGRDVLGLYTLFLPLIAEAAPETPADGETADLVLTGALATLPLALAGTGWFVVERWIWYGAELRTLQRDGAWSTAVLLDVEVGVSASIDFGGEPLITIARERPLKARYKAVGFRFGSSATGELILHPIFDSSRGYTLDIAPESLEVREPLGSILRIVGARISRSNPVLLEVELGGAVDLGVVALERCGVRVTLDGTPPSVELTALGARVNVPGALEGAGYFRIDQAGFAGRVDLTVVPLDLRVAAAIRVENIPASAGGPATGVAVALEVEFPVAIPLANSGLGIYGLIGLFAMHFTRNEAPDAASTTKALSWLRRADGDPTRIEDPSLWRAQVDSWAFGVGAIVGTMGSSVVFNMKGVVLLELPGPRLLLMMKANLLVPMPELKGDAEGTLLAVVDLDMVANTLTIGIVVDYEIDPILQIRIPVEAFFDTDDPEQWHIYVGKYADPVRARVLFVFTGTAYLMLVGDGTSNPDLPTNLPKPAGFAIATGVHVSMLWGSRPARLYAELAAGFDAILGFSPLLVAGKIYARGELRLFIVSLSARADLDVRLGELPGTDESGYRVHGEVCGSVDFFFFEIEGCVDLTLEDNAPPPISIPTLVSGLSLISRSPALVHGTGSDQPIDAALAEGIEGDSAPSWGALTGDARRAAEVPIDAIPVVMCTAPPFDAPHPGDTSRPEVTFRGDPLGGASGGREVQRSDDHLTYDLESVELIGPVTAGNTPATWWTLRPPTEANESAQLALLSWVPNATPKALQSSETLEETVTDRWGTVCWTAAPPTRVLWTFRFEPLGPSASGWSVDGEPWPDPQETVRSTPAPTVLDVSERWRCGDPVADDLRGITQAEVVGAQVACPQKNGRPDVLDDVRAATSASAAVFARQVETLEEAWISPTELFRRLDLGLELPRSALLHTTALDGGVTRPAAFVAARKCPSRVLASPRFDRLKPVPPWDAGSEEEVLARWAARDFDPGDLADAVVLRPGAFEDASVLLFVARRLLRRGLFVRAVADDGTIVDEHVADGSDIVSWATLPATWTDVAGPWDDDVQLVMQHLLTLPREEYVAILATVKGGAEANSVIVGVRPGHDLSEALSGPGYYVAAFEALTWAETARFGYDEQTVERNRSVLDAALGPESASVALLEPGTAYQVVVGWRAHAENSSGDTADLPTQTQRFWFRTASEAPSRLDPWVLATSPYEGERHVFGAEPLQITLGTNNIQQLFAEYGFRLEVRLEAASGRHPDPAETGVPHPLVIEPATLANVVASVLSPWEEAVVALVEGTCVNVDGERVRHQTQSIPIPLNPATDYLLDIERVPSSAPAGTRGDRVFRRSFTTSRFPTLADLVESLQGTRVVHRYAPAGAMAAIGAQFAAAPPQGDQLDVAFESQGLERLPVPDAPRVVVFWDGDAVPQPAAVLLDCPEPLWRSRERPEKHLISGTDLSHYTYRLEPWVVVEAGGPESDATVSRILQAPGGQRGLIVLAGGNRGRRLQLVLRRRAFTEPYLDGPAATDQVERIVDVSLVRAPWEETP